jgi:hypothetical protein
MIDGMLIINLPPVVARTIEEEDRDQDPDLEEDTHEEEADHIQGVVQGHIKEESNVRRRR